MSLFSPGSLPARKFAAGLFTIRSYLLLLIVAVIVPMMVLVAILAWDYGTAGRRTIEAQRLDAANNLKHLVDREIQATAGFLSGLATSLAQHPSDPRIAESAIAAARSDGFAAVVVHDRAGHQLFVAPLGVAASLTATRDLGVAEVVASHKPFVTDFVADAGEHKPGLFFVSVPVLVDGQVALVLSGGLQPQRLQPLMAEAGLGDGWRAAIVDREGIILARRDRPDLYVGTHAQKPMVEVARGKQSAGLFDVVSRDGVDMKNSYVRSAFSGWTAAVAVPAAVVDAPMHRTALTMAAAGLALALVSLLLGALVAGRISRAVQQLGVASAAFASGFPVPLPTSKLTELRDVAQAMQVSAERARRREASAREAQPQV
ncbi:MAG: cache domain-containing protein [Reyranella sp.]|nr:cache domain-containing protein [Reyranella sp.]